MVSPIKRLLRREIIFYWILAHYTTVIIQIQADFLLMEAKKEHKQSRKSRDEYNSGRSSGKTG